MKKLQIGNVTLDNPVILAPMAIRNIVTARMVETLPPVMIPYCSITPSEKIPAGQIPRPIFFRRL